MVANWGELYYDRTQMVYSICLAACAQGSTKISGAAKYNYDHLLSFLQELGIKCIETQEHLYIEGQGIRASWKDLFDPWQMCFSQAGLFFQLWFLSNDLDHKSFVVIDSEKSYQRLIFWQKYFDFDIERHDQLAEISFSNVERSPLPSQNYWQQIRWVLDNLRAGQALDYVQDSVVAEDFINLLTHFCNDFKRSTETENDPIKKRLALLSKQSLPKKYRFILFGGAQLKARSLRPVADSYHVNFYASWAVVASLNHHLNKTLVLDNVDASKAGLTWLNCLKRMGCEFNVLNKYSRNKNHVLNLELNTTKSFKLKARTFKGEVMDNLQEILPLVAVVCAFTVGESIIHLNPSDAKKNITILESITTNLRLAGCDVGMFNEGLIIRGREQLDEAVFDAQGDETLSYAYWLLAKATQGRSEVINFATHSQRFPQLLVKPQGVNE